MSDSILKQDRPSPCPSPSPSPAPFDATFEPYQPAPGQVGNLTTAQELALQTLKTQLQNEGHFVEERMDDPMLLRFLRARKFNIAKAKEMLLSAEKWRKDMEVDDVVRNFVFTEKQQIDQYYPQYYHKTDKQGRPIYIERLGKLNVKALYHITTKDRLIKRLISEYEKFLTERVPACSAAVGHPVETVCTILDLQGVTLHSFYLVSDYVQEASKIGQDRYPECMGRFFIVNAPWGFSAVWKFIKPWLDEVTVSKIDILSSSSYKQTLLNEIPAENLPADLGGTCRCEGGCSLSDAGPWNPGHETGDGDA